MNLILLFSLFYTLSGRIGKVVASHADCCRIDSRRRQYLFILCTKVLGGGYCLGTAHEGGGATTQLDLPSLTPLPMAAALGYFSTLLQVVDN